MVYKVLSPFLFVLVLNTSTCKILKDAPWCMMFANDVVMITEIKEQIESDLERWENKLERHSLNASREI